MKLKEYDSYLEELENEFPELKGSSIDKIVKHGLNYILKYRKTGVDFYINDNINLNYYMYFGDISTTEKERNKIHLKKKARKLRHLYVSSKKEYDGYYYFGLTNEQKEKYDKEGIIDNNAYCKIIDEAQLRGDIKHIYRVKMENKNTWKFIITNDETSDAEYIQRREGKGFTDI